MRFIQLVGGITIAIVFAIGFAWTVLNVRFGKTSENPTVEKKGKQ